MFLDAHGELFLLRHGMCQIDLLVSIGGRLGVISHRMHETWTLLGEGEMWS